MMRTDGFSLFDTAIGACGIVWGAGGVTGVQLPEAHEAATRERLCERFPNSRESAPPSDVRHAITRIVLLLEGDPVDLSSIPLDMEGVPPFHRRVYELARALPTGQTITYGQLAARIRSPGAARAVGQALGRNPFALIVPCHRVLASGGRAGGFSANGGVTTKLRLLAIEGAAAVSPPEPLGFDTAAAVEHVREADPALASVIEAVGPFRMRRKTSPSVFVALAESIVHQQLTTKAAATIYGRLCALFPRAHEGPTPDRVLRASDEKLRSAGLSGPKVLALRDLARKAKAGELPTLTEATRMDDEDIVERLTRVRGVGRWTAEMFLVFRLGRPDVLPLDDYALRKSLGAALRREALPSRAELETRGARWAPYRTIASWYLWQALELPTRPRPAPPLAGQSSGPHPRCE